MAQRVYEVRVKRTHLHIGNFDRIRKAVQVARRQQRRHTVKRGPAWKRDPRDAETEILKRGVVMTQDEIRAEWIRA